MPEYLAPGVFVEEVSFRSKSIEGVGTSVAAIVGPTRTGPLRGKPEVCTSFADFLRTYGDAEDLTLDGEAVLNHTAIAARAFFDNGGKQLYVARVAAGVNGTDAQGAGSSADFAGAADDAGIVGFQGRFPGARDLTLELRWRDSENLLKRERVNVPDEGEVVFLEATGLPPEVRATGVAGDVPPARFPMSFRGLVRRNGDHYVIVDNLAEITAASGTTTPDQLAPDGETEGQLMRAGVAAAASATFTRVYARQPAGGALADGTSAEIAFTAETDLSDFTGADHWGALTRLRGTIDAAGSTLTIAADPVNPGVTAPVTLRLAALAAAPGAASAVIVKRAFDIDVRLADADGEQGEILYSYTGMTTAPGGDTSMETVMAATPERRLDALTSPVACTIADTRDPGAVAVTGDDVLSALEGLFESDFLNPPPTDLTGPRYLIRLTGGSDGAVPGSTDYAGEVDEVQGSTGLAALEDIDDIAIVMTPAAAAHADSHQAVVAAMQAHCRRMRYRVGIVDPQEGMALSEVRDFAANFDDSRLALYYPWVVTADPTGRRPTITVPPGGFIAGVYANTDVTRGVHKAPANEVVLGALRFAQDINRFQQELLNPNGINCLRSFPGRGHRVWGGRTLSSDPEWKYVNVRRYFLYLERSIDVSTQWVVFEPNGERLWANVTATVEAFLYNEWFNGRLLGGSAKEAFFVRCDRSTMTQNDLDNGRLVCLVGVAPLRPAEFVVFRIGQKTADA
ncbi:MAG: phage tail sheath subtilisin-like domain-containing protein [Thiohalocapsa sp.]|uniref:phage tail sheath family protein n=1 Tax=Thiohalocapsa sp. TaxID=2497641 RepID=UPI0025FF5433|nr:phage tail sheath subtilisin-like domain-containing protein [Thiohalocapsa sp.]MCG6942860.1 phage tail sheath subtilisin-like domain-containing protein [Thiohalocapsa sp.]